MILAGVPVRARREVMTGARDREGCVQRTDLQPLACCNKNTTVRGTPARRGLCQHPQLHAPPLQLCTVLPTACTRHHPDQPVGPSERESSWTLPGVSGRGQQRQQKGGWAANSLAHTAIPSLCCRRISQPFLPVPPLGATMSNE